MEIAWTPKHTYRFLATVRPIVGFGIIECDFIVGSYIRTRWSFVVGIFVFTFINEYKKDGV